MTFSPSVRRRSARFPGAIDPVTPNMPTCFAGFAVAAPVAARPAAAEAPYQALTKSLRYLLKKQQLYQEQSL